MTVRVRMLVLSLVGVLLTAWGAYGPFVPSPYEIFWMINPLDSTIRFSGGLLAVAAMLIAFRRAPDGPLWKLFLLYIAANGIWDLGYIRTDLTWTLGEVLRPLAPFVLIHLMLAFPSGRLTDRFDRRFVTALYTFGIGTAVAFSLVSDPHFTNCGFCPRNVFVVWPNAELAWMFGNPGALGLVTPLIGTIVLARLWVHWRRAGPALRRALLPVIVPAPFVFAQMAVWDLAGVNQAETDWIRVIMLNSVFLLPYWLVPAGFLFGVLRARLARGSVAELAVELGRGAPLGRLRDILARALRDPSLVLAFPAWSGSGYVDAQGQPVDVPEPSPGRALTRLEHDQATLAVLIHDPAIDAEDPGLVEAVGSIARLALENERLGAQVRAQLDEVVASRARIVEATDAERRRIERDLHDGAQQRLVALAMRLEQARTQSSGMADLIDATMAELLAAITEVRSLARGLHPTILTEAGLGAAVEALAERTPLPVRVDVPEERFPPQVEVAAYYVIAEALTNIVRYAHASEARVAVRREEGGRLLVEVTDNGQGGADAGAGTGLRGLSDRLAAIGGELSVRSPTGGGTSVTAMMPASA